MTGGEMGQLMKMNLQLRLESLSQPRHVLCKGLHPERCFASVVGQEPALWIPFLVDEMSTLALELLVSPKHIEGSSAQHNAALLVTLGKTDHLATSRDHLECSINPEQSFSPIDVRPFEATKFAPAGACEDC